MSDIRIYFLERFSPVFTNDVNRLKDIDSGNLLHTQLAVYSKGEATPSSDLILPGTSVVIWHSTWEPWVGDDRVVRNVYEIDDRVFRLIRQSYIQTFKSYEKERMNIEDETERAIATAIKKLKALGERRIANLQEADLERVIRQFVGE